MRNIPNEKSACERFLQFMEMSHQHLCVFYMMSLMNKFFKMLTLFVRNCIYQRILGFKGVPDSRKRISAQGDLLS